MGREIEEERTVAALEQGRERPVIEISECTFRKGCKDLIHYILALPFRLRNPAHTIPEGTRSQVKIAAVLFEYILHQVRIEGGTHTAKKIPDSRSIRAMQICKVPIYLYPSNTVRTSVGDAVRQKFLVRCGCAYSS